MAKVNISGYGDDLTINGVRIGDLGPAEHEAIELEKGGQNYSPLENVVVSSVLDSSTLICRKPDPEGIKVKKEPVCASRLSFVAGFRLIVTMTNA